MFEITEDWIARNPTKAGGYKAAQLRLIGVSWPPKHGWKKRASGKLITEEARTEFESYGSGSDPAVTGPSVFVPLCDCTTPPWEECEHTDALAESAMREMLA